MKEHPIIFTTESVKAILEGRKTQTRRTAGLEFINRRPEIWVLGGLHDGIALFDIKAELDRSLDPSLPIHNLQRIKCPYGQAGDRLWVRETWSTEIRYNHLKPSEIPNTAKIFYWADGFNSFGLPIEEECFMNKRSPLFMPRWASRITLEITDIRVERLQEITEEDAKAEGTQLFHVGRFEPYIPVWSVWSMNGYPSSLIGDTPRDAFRFFWDSLNAKRGYGWETNPWVWVISFATGVRLK